MEDLDEKLMFLIVCARKGDAIDVIISELKALIKSRELLARKEELKTLMKVRSLTPGYEEFTQEIKDALAAIERELDENKS